MSCDGGHLGFPIGIKNSNLVKDIPMIIPLQFGFSQFISFREEDLWNFSQSEHIIGPGSHIEYPTGTKNSNFVEDHPRNLPAKFGSNRPCGFGEEAWNVKSLQTTDNRRRTPSDGSDMEHELLTPLGNLSSPPVYNGVHVALSLVFCIVFCRSLFVLFL
jgi:hypothetical protein